MLKNILLTTLIGFIFFNSCSSSKNEATKNEGKVNLICLKENDTLFIKVVNNTDSIIYIPKEYDGDYTNNDDTLHLETNSKQEYSTTYYYKYKNVFPFEFYTTKKIQGYTPDTVEHYRKQTFFYNQFRVQPIFGIMPDSAYTVKLVFNTPKYATVVKAVFYNKQFLNKERVEKIDYVLEDYLEFDSLNAKYITSPIIMRYH